MKPGMQVIARARPPLAEEYLCQVADVPENRDRKACDCGRAGCTEYRVLECVEQPGILRYVGECRIRAVQ